MAHGPTIAMAALPSAKESPLYFSRGASASSYMVRQNFATASPSAELNVGLPPTTSCLPPVSAANKRVEVEPGLEELVGRRGPDRRLRHLRRHQLAGRVEESGIRVQRGAVRVQAGLLEQLLVEEDSNGIGLPWQLAELAVGGGVLLGDVTASGTRRRTRRPGSRRAPPGRPSSRTRAPPPGPY